MYTFLIVALLILLFLIGVFVVLALFVPANWQIEEQTIVDAQPETLFPLINTPANWPKWTTWSTKYDESIQFEYGKVPQGLGAIQNWTSLQMNGTLTIVQTIQNESIQFHLALDNNRYILHAQIRLAEINLQTAVIWTMKFDTESYNPIQRLQTGTLKKLMRFNMKASLKEMKKRFKR